MQLKRYYAAFVLIFPAFSFLSAQTNTLDLPFEHVTITGESLTELQGAAIGEIFVARFTTAWEVVPFQIDERDDASGSFFETDNVQGFDANDEIVVMTKSVGNAGQGWFPNTESEAYDRYEVEITNTLDGTSGWIYIYRSSNPPSLDNTDYVSHIPSTTSTATDTVVGKTYVIANGEVGFPNFISIPSQAGGTGVDLLQSQEITIETSFQGFVLTESSFVVENVAIIDGNLVVRKELTVSLLGQSLPIPVNYFGYTAEIFGEFEIPEEIDLGFAKIRITKVIQSFNLTPAAIGMELYSMNNTAIQVDGTPDANFNNTVEEGINRFLFKGTQGSFVNNLIVPAIGESQQIFYEDDASVEAYGNTGFLLEGEAVFGTTPLGVTILFPGAVADGDEDQFTGTEEVEPQTSFQKQNFDEVTSIRDDESGVPKTFALQQNFPNPFNPTTTIRYRLPASVGENKTTLKIYDLLGKEIRTLVDERVAPGFYSVLWDGRDDSGVAVSSGVYFYQLRSGDFQDLRKLVLVK